MRNKNMNLLANKLVDAFLKKKIISPIPIKYCKNIDKANEFRKFCEKKINKPIIGFKAGGTGIALLKKLKEKEPFYASVYEQNFLKNNTNVFGIVEMLQILKKTFRVSETCQNIDTYICFGNAFKINGLKNICPRPRYDRHFLLHYSILTALFNTDVIIEY